MTQWLWKLKRFARSMWFRTTLFSLLGIVTVLLAALFQRWIPESWVGYLGEGAVDSILQILAASMLAVTTFSLSILVSAYASASSSATPRATELLINDATANNALSTFLGAFLFSIVGIVSLKTGLYLEQGRILLFIVTIGMIVLIVTTLVHWINYLSTLGRMGHTITRLEQIATREIRRYLKNPHWGAMPWDRQADPLPEQALIVRARQSGYVQLVDVAHLQEALDDHAAASVQLCVLALPGQFVASGSTPLCAIIGLEALSDEAMQALEDALRQGFSLGLNRTFDNDPRFGLVAMAEVACKALSPGINDSGTAIDVINRSLRLLELWGERDAFETADEAHKAPACSRVKVPKMALADVFDDFFPLVGRDGAGQREIGIRLQKVLIALSSSPDPTMRRLARAHAQEALARNRQALDFAPDLDAIEAVHHQAWPRTETDSKDRA